jgi:uncharacterized protein DUF7010
MKLDVVTGIVGVPRWNTSALSVKIFSACKDFLSMHPDDPGWPLLWGFVSLRRKSAGFSLAEMKNGTEEQRGLLRQIRRGLRWATLIEIMLCSVAVGSVEYLHRHDLIWPALGIAVSLHFLPLGWLFRVRRYHFIGMVGTVVCLVAMAAFNTPVSALVAAAGMCLNMWGTASWLLARSEQMTMQAIEKSTAAAKA